MTLAGGTQASDRLYVDLAGHPAAADALADWKTRSPTPLIRRSKVHDLSAFIAELGTDKAVKNLRKMGGAASAIVLLAAVFIVFTAIAAGAANGVANSPCCAPSVRRAQIFRVVLLEGRMPRPHRQRHRRHPGRLVTAAGPRIRATRPVRRGSSRISPVSRPSWPARWAGGDRPRDRRCVGRPRPPIEAMGETSATKGGGIVVRSIAGVVLFAVAIGLVLAAPSAARPSSGRQRCGGSGRSSLSPHCCSSWSSSWWNPSAAVAARRLGVPADRWPNRRACNAPGRRGTILTLAVCLGLSVTMNVWGRSMVLPFMPSPDLPDQVISFKPGGVPYDVATAHRRSRRPGPPARPAHGGRTTRPRARDAGQTDGKPDEISIQVLGIEPAAVVADRRTTAATDGYA